MNLVSFRRCHDGVEPYATHKRTKYPCTQLGDKISTRIESLGIEPIKLPTKHDSNK